MLYLLEEELMERIYKEKVKNEDFPHYQIMAGEDREMQYLKDKFTEKGLQVGNMNFVRQEPYSKITCNINEVPFVFGAKDGLVGTEDYNTAYVWFNIQEVKHMFRFSRRKGV